MKCQIIKLKSGEEIICDIGVTSKTKCELANPYVFRSTTMINHVIGIPYEFTSLKDWLILTNNKKITIPTNHIVSIIQPSNETKKIYREELKRARNSKKNIIPENTNSNVENKHNISSENDKDKQDKQELKEFIENLFNNIFNNESNESNESDTSTAEDFSNSMTPEDEYEAYNQAFPPRKRKNNKNVPLIQMSMVFPPEVIINLMESGFINVNDINKIAKEIKNNLKFTGDERHRKDFGNKLTDWNPDINSDDYK